MNDNPEVPKAARDAQYQIVEVRPGRPGETYTPNPTWLEPGLIVPRPVPELDADGNPWKILANGSHFGASNGTPYCLEWLTGPPPPASDPRPAQTPDRKQDRPRRPRPPEDNSQRRNRAAALRRQAGPEPATRTARPREPEPVRQPDRQFRR